MVGEAILIHIHYIRFYGEISKFFIFYYFDSDPRFPPFLPQGLEVMIFEYSAPGYVR